VGFHVLYLTGAPASGKSSLCKALAGSVADVEVFSYSDELRSFIAKGGRQELAENEIREKSAQVITPEDVRAVDEKLARVIVESRGHRHVVIDSHAVTKEQYGFRVTAFTRVRLRDISPSLIVVLYVNGEETQRRISADSGGRPKPSIFEADFHTHLQATVAFTYAFELGCPIHYLDSTKTVDELVRRIAALLNRNERGA
jgi:adenylate kinase